MSWAGSEASDSRSCWEPGGRVTTAPRGEDHSPSGPGPCQLICLGGPSEAGGLRPGRVGLGLLWGLVTSLSPAQPRVGLNTLETHLYFLPAPAVWVHLPGPFWLSPPKMVLQVRGHRVPSCEHWRLWVRPSSPFGVDFRGSNPGGSWSSYPKAPNQTLCYPASQGPGASPMENLFSGLTQGSE